MSQHGLPFTNLVWHVPSVLMRSIADWLPWHLQISGNGYQRSSRISIDNFLHALYKLRCPNNVNAFCSSLQATHLCWRLPVASELCAHTNWRLPKTSTSFHLMASLISSPLILCKDKSTLIDYNITAGAQSHVFKYHRHPVLCIHLHAFISNSLMFHLGGQLGLYFNEHLLWIRST